VNDQAPLFPLIGALRDLVLWLADARTEGVVIGGVASSILGRPRMTRDVDLLVLVEDSDWVAFLNHAGNHGIEPRRQDVLEFARRSRVLLLRHLPTDINVDAVLGLIPFERQVIQRANVVRLAGVRVPLPTPEDMIIMKLVARRPQDLDDVRGIIAANTDLDLDYIRRITSQFATELDVPDMVRDLDELL